LLLACGCGLSSHYRVVNVHLSINFQIYDWRPEFYNDTNDLPEKMPRHLKEYIYTQARVDRRKVSGHVFAYYSVEIPTRRSFVIEFIIPKFIEGSTCFERHTAHHQEP